MAEIIPKSALLNSSSVGSGSLRKHLVGRKDYALSKKQQILAVRELDRNYTHTAEVLLENRLYAEKILKVLVAHAFSCQDRGIYRYTPAEIGKHIQYSE